MGYKRGWNTERIVDDLQHCAAEMNSPYNDGWLQWSAKQDLYRVKFEAERLLSRAPTFAGEVEWLHEQERLRIIGILKNEM